MKPVLIITIAIIAAAFITPLYRKANAQVVPASDAKGFAVVELFTSEGCSSCPPADELMAKLQQVYAGKPLYILAFHVDYWNRLGWKDVFSDGAYTNRQRRYANWLHLETVYTPQVVVNGTREYVGADENAITGAINQSLGQPAVSTLTGKARHTGDTIAVQVEPAAEKNTELVLALVQHAAQSNVRAGENAGKQLSHIQIVRQLLYVSAHEKSSVTMMAPKGFNEKDWELIGFTQNKRDGRIMNAARFSFQ